MACSNRDPIEGYAGICEQGLSKTVDNLSRDIWWSNEIRTDHLVNTIQQY
jgi:hypothetical protein